MVPLSIAEYTQENPYPIVPGQFFLAEAEPIFNIPQDLEGQFILKSSRAREGLQHLMAGFADPGWHGSRLMLELKNVRQLHKIGIWPGLKIGQMKFSRMDAIPKQCYATTGRYNNNVIVTPSKG
jgi:dCTP deaminase